MPHEVVGQEEGEVASETHAHDRGGARRGKLGAGEGRRHGDHQEEQAHQHDGGVDHQGVIRREAHQLDGSSKARAVHGLEREFGALTRRPRANVPADGPTVGHGLAVDRNDARLGAGQSNVGVDGRRSENPRTDVAGPKDGYARPGLADLQAE